MWPAFEPWEAQIRWLIAISMLLRGSRAVLGRPWDIVNVLIHRSGSLQRRTVAQSEECCMVPRFTGEFCLFCPRGISVDMIFSWKWELAIPSSLSAYPLSYIGQNRGWGNDKTMDRMGEREKKNSSIFPRWKEIEEKMRWGAKVNI